MDFHLPNHLFFPSVYRAIVKMPGKQPGKRSHASAENSDPSSCGDDLTSTSPYYSAYRPQYLSDSATAHPYTPNLDPDLFPSYQSNKRQQPPAEEQGYRETSYEDGYNHGRRLSELADCALSYPQPLPSEGYYHQQMSHEDGLNQQSSQIIDRADPHPQHYYQALAPDPDMPPESQPSHSSPNSTTERDKRIEKTNRRLDAVNGVIIPSRLAPGEVPKNLQSRSRAGTPLTLLCPLCRGGFGKKDHIKSHFPACVERNGNPDGLRWDHRLPSSKPGPRPSMHLTGGKNKEGAKFWKRTWGSSWRGQQRSRSQSPWGRFE